MKKFVMRAILFACESHFFVQFFFSIFPLFLLPWKPLPLLWKGYYIYLLRRKAFVIFLNLSLLTYDSSFMQASPQMTLFTGSSRVAEKLAVDLKGRVKLEDAGFDWKILGPDVEEVPYKQILHLIIQFFFEV